MDPNSNTPIVVLKGVNEDAILPIWVGAYEANAIALEIEKVVPQRPMTHDLLRNFITELGYKVNKISVTELVDNTFYAVVEIINSQNNVIYLDSRPSDAIALALRTDCPIYVDRKVLEISSVSLTTTNTIDNFEDRPRIAEEWPDLIG